MASCCPKSFFVQGVCEILALYWDIVPGELTRAFVMRIVDKLAMDSSSIGCRAAAVEGLTHLSSQHLAHPILKSKAFSLFSPIFFLLEIGIGFLILFFLLPSLQHICPDSAR